MRFVRSGECSTRRPLPLAIRTNVGQVVSIRTLEKQITRLLSSQFPELKAIGEDLKEACQRPSEDLWGELSESGRGQAEPLAPTLTARTSLRIPPFFA